jgi:ribosomal protein S18 acetylase RimI-like enzyme
MKNKDIQLQNETKQRYIHRMELKDETLEISAPDGITIFSYDRKRHHDRIPAVYAEAFMESPWPADLDCFPEFNPLGVFIAESADTKETVGYVVSFQRESIGYVSVLAVVPPYQRRGIGRALAHTAITYLRSLAGVETIQVDAFTDSIPAVVFYKEFGFRVLHTYEDKIKNQAP